MGLIRYSKKVLCAALVFTTFSVSHGYGQKAALPSNALRVFIRESKRVPFWTKKSPSAIAQKLTTDLETEPEKALALANWICHNIKYDYKTFKRFKIPDRSSAQILRKKRAICGEFSRIYQEMCEAVDLECEVVHGYIEDQYRIPGDSLYFVEHSWNTIRIDGDWYLVDLAWANGYVVEKKQYIRRFLWKHLNLPFYLKWRFKREVNLQWLYVDPAKFIHSHLPIIPDFQLTEQKLPANVFAMGSYHISQFQNEHPLNGVTNDDMGRFNDLSEYSKHIYVVNNAPTFNATNHGTVGYAYYEAFFEKLNYHFDFDENITSENIGALKELDSLAVLADSFIYLGRDDIQRFVDTLTRRNIGWKKERFGVNRALLGELRMLEWSKRRVANLRLKHFRKIKGTLSVYKVIERTIDQTPINHTQRPPKARENSISKADFQKQLSLNTHKIDSLENVMDSLMRLNSAKRTLKTYDNMERDLLEFELYQKEITTYVFYSAMYFGIIHFTPLFIEKEALWKQLNDLKREHKTVFSQLTQDQDTFLTVYSRLLRDYRFQTKQTLRYIKLVKRTSFSDLGEDSCFQNLTIQFDSFVSEQTERLNDLSKVQKLVAKVMKKEMK